jgi:hypothetical protein
MKKLFTILFICFALQSFAQGNLQFNQVLTFTGSIQNGTNIILDTVPQGKVWRVEAIGIGTPTNYVNLTINNKIYRNYFTTGNNYSASAAAIKENLWLKYEDVVGYRYDWCNYCSSSDYVISIVEFNIVP